MSPVAAGPVQPWPSFSEASLSLSQTPSASSAAGSLCDFLVASHSLLSHNWAESRAWPSYQVRRGRLAAQSRRPAWLQVHDEVPSGTPGERHHPLFPGVLAVPACELAAVLDGRLVVLLT